VGATFTPDVFACAVSLCGPSNLVTFLKSYAAAYEFEKAHFGLVFGDVESEQAFLRSRSPLFKAEKIRIPLLIAHGANDPLVVQAEADQIVKAARNAGKDVEYLLFPDEGHGLTRPQNRMKFCAAVERFLGRHLGGRVAPMSDQ
jgi:dipeptidyl aminopeptidase/acylaminoacyl peptidase